MNQPAHWSRIAPSARQRRAQHRQALPRHREEPPQRPLRIERTVMPPRRHDRDGEERAADDRDDEQARHRPVRDLRRSDHVQDQQQGGEEIEQAVSEDRADERAARPRPRGTWRRSTATRASSPIRLGRTAFASRPTENAEKTCRSAAAAARAPG